MSRTARWKAATIVGVTMVWFCALMLSVSATSPYSIQPDVEVLGIVEASDARSDLLSSRSDGRVAEVATTVAARSRSSVVTPGSIQLGEAPTLSVSSSGVGGSAVDRATSSASPGIERVSAAALELVRFDWSGTFPDWHIEFLDSRNGLRALTFPREQRIEVYVRDQDTASTLHRVITHELGHVVDVEFNSSDERIRWMIERGISDEVAWWPSASAPDFATGAGDFAEAFAVWEAGIQSRSTVAGQPDAAAVALLIELASS